MYNTDIRAGYITYVSRSTSTHVYENVKIPNQKTKINNIRHIGTYIRVREINESWTIIIKYLY